MSERFFLPTPPQAGRAALEGDEARHLAQVLRARIDDRVHVFDGRGREWLARVTGLGRDRVELAIEADLPASHPPAGPPVTLAVALPKGDRQKWLVEKLTELGVERLVPLATARGVAEATPAARARLERGVIEACKQCGRTRLMEVTPGRPLDRLLEEAAAGRCVVFADPGGRRLDATCIPPGTTEIVALVGPEGGFTSAECALAARAGAIPVALGPHILRVETAAIALAARLVAESSAPAC